MARPKFKPLQRPETALLYGNTGTGKTSACIFLAMWMYERFGLTTRLISNDLGGWGPIENEGLISAGIVKPFNVSGRTNLLADMRKLSKGYWPKIITVDEEVNLPDGTSEIRPVKRRVVMEDKEELSKVGLYFIEGATSTSTAFLKHITKSGEKIGPQDTAGKYEEDGEVFGGNSPGHYNIVQTEMYSLFGNFASLPSPVRLVCWTSHVGKGTLKRTGESCYAPQLAGDAKNSEVPQWVGDCFHLEDTPEIVGPDGHEIQAKSVRAYYINHPDKETEVNYLCKARTAPSLVGDLREKFPGGFIPLGLEKGNSIDQYFEYMENHRTVNVDKVTKWKEAIDARG